MSFIQYLNYEKRVLLNFERFTVLGAEMTLTKSQNNFTDISALNFVRLVAAELFVCCKMESVFFLNKIFIY